jgi:hypothetical protein
MLGALITLEPSEVVFGPEKRRKHFPIPNAVHKGTGWSVRGIWKMVHHDARLLTPSILNDIFFTAGIFLTLSRGLSQVGAKRAKAGRQCVD